MTTNLRSRMAAVTLAVVATGGAMAAFAGPASAATPTYDIVQHDTGSTVSMSKTAKVECPANEVVLGAGVLQGADGQAPVESLVPSRTSVTAYAHVDQDGDSSSWDLDVYAVCGALPPNYFIKSGVSSSSNTLATATAACPGGTEALGTGWSTTPSNKVDDGQVIVGTVLPLSRTSSGTIDTVDVTAWPDQDGTIGPWTVTAYAVCGSEASGSHLVTTHGTPGSTMWQGAITNCPAGEYVTGGGFTGGGREVVLHNMDFGFNPTTGIHAMYSTMVEDQDGYSSNWTHNGYAICSKL